MNAKYLAVAVLATALTSTDVVAQHGHSGSSGHVKLHVNPRWDECSFQLDPSLTQSAWHQFTGEAGLVTYLRTLADARPMGRGKFEVSMLQWSTGIRHTDAAWNDTFVHPDSDHVLFEGSRLKFPGVMVRAGLTARTDMALYATKSPGGNYGFYGASLQRTIVGDEKSPWSAAGRASFTKMFGPEDIDFIVYGAELVASRRVELNRWVSVSPYAGVSGYLSSSHEKSAVVNLNDEHVAGARALMGATFRVSRIQIGAQYDAARVQSVSFKVGIGG